jgi:hypothetical protein
MSIAISSLPDHGPLHLADRRRLGGDDSSKKGDTFTSSSRGTSDERYTLADLARSTFLIRRLTNLCSQVAFQSIHRSSPKSGLDGASALPILPCQLRKKRAKRLVERGFLFDPDPRSVTWSNTPARDADMVRKAADWFEHTGVGLITPEM